MLVSDREARGSELSRWVDGVDRATPAGPCFVAERVFPFEHRHGRQALGDALGVSQRALALLARQPLVGPLDVRDALFLDTETTGLSGGAGTYVFLIGVGRFEARGFVVRQFFMRDYGEEPALLHLLDELGAAARSLVTYNGRAFDWPLLETRYVMALRARPRLRPAAHLDLLFPSRRVWRGRVPDCSLTTLERRVLGYERVGDVPGWVIPSLYFGFLRHGACQPVAQVFAHNRDDVLSLAALIGRLGRLLDDPLAAGRRAEDLLAVGRLYEEQGLGEEALACYERGAQLAQSSPQRCALLTRLAALYKRRGERVRAVALWRELALSGLGDDVSALVELAKHHEHRERDYLSAIDVVQQALAIVELRELGHRGPFSGEGRVELERRLARLLRKAGAERLGLER